MQLHFKQLGQGEPLVLLHGLFGSADNWFGGRAQAGGKVFTYSSPICGITASRRMMSKWITR